MGRHLRSRASLTAPVSLANCACVYGVKRSHVCAAGDEISAVRCGLVMHPCDRDSSLLLPRRDLLAELNQRVRRAVALPVRIAVKDIYDETCTELLISAPLDSGALRELDKDLSVAS